MYVGQVNQHINSFNEFYNNKYDQSYPISEFWLQILDSRENFPNPNSLINFQRGSFIVGTGKADNYSEAEEQKIWDKYFHLASASIPISHISKIQEPSIGSPIFFTNDFCTLSTSYLINSITSHSVQTLAKNFKNPNIAEIGPGWGAAAEQIIQCMNPNLYYIIDLPHNLLISSFFLNHTHPEYTPYFGLPTEAIPAKSLIYTFANMNEKVPFKFDIILNSFSFQEMEKNIIEGYIQWAYENLKEGGLLISINSHNKTTVKHPSDYYHPGLNLTMLDNFRKSPPNILNTVPYLAVFKKEPATYSTSDFNLIGYLAQLGIDINSTSKYLEQNKAVELTDDILHILKLYKNIYNKNIFLKLWQNSDFSAHQFAYLKLNTFACILKYLPNLDKDLIDNYLWLKEECEQLIALKSRKALRAYLDKIMEPFSDKKLITS